MGYNDYLMEQERARRGKSRKKAAPTVTQLESDEESNSAKIQFSYVVDKVKKTGRLVIERATFDELFTFVTDNDVVRNTQKEFGLYRALCSTEEGLEKALDEINTRRRSAAKWCKSKNIRYVLKTARTEKNARDDFKERNFPRAYFSCLFDDEGLAQIKHVTALTGLMTFDIENLTPEIVDRVRADKYVRWMMPSVSGGGNYWCIVEAAGLTVDNYKTMWKAVETYLIDTYNIPKSDDINDFTRIRYLGFVEAADITYNPKSTVWTQKGMVARSNDSSAVKAYKEALLHKPVDNNAAIAIYMLLRTSKTPEATVKEMETFNFSTSDSLQDARERHGYYAQWESDYGKQFDAAHDDPEFPTKILWNTITHDICLKREDGSYMPLDEKDLYELWYRTTEKVDKYPVRAFNTWLGVVKANCKRVNPIREFLNSLKWDGVKRFEQLGGYCTFEDDTRSEEFGEHVRKHIIRGLRMLEHGDMVNRVNFVLVGPLRIGKSKLLMLLTLAGQQDFWSTEASLDDKELLFTMCRNVNVIIEELDVVRKYEVDAFKPVISFSGADLRTPYARVGTYRKRIATLWSTTNKVDFLGEGSERWLIVQVKAIDWKRYVADKFDFKQLWAEAYNDLLQDRTAGELTEAESEKLREVEENHRYVSLTESLVDDNWEEDTTMMSFVRAIDVIEAFGDNRHIRAVDVGKSLVAKFSHVKQKKTMHEKKRGTFFSIKKRMDTTEETKGRGAFIPATSSSNGQKTSGKADDLPF
jgi:hypothetical protein